MNPQDVLAQARDAVTVKRVFGDPYEAGGVTFIPVARVRGGGGGGQGQNTRDGEGASNSGWGGGFGFAADPVGAYVLKNGEVQWKPAVNVNKIVLGGQIVALVALLTVRYAMKVWARGVRR